MLAGATTSQQNCSMHTHVWVVDEQNGFCIRFFRNEIAFTKGPAILFLVGISSDRIGTAPAIQLDLFLPAMSMALLSLRYPMSS
jgi:hypothetical protein